MKKHKSIQVKVIEMDDEVDMDFSQNPSTLNCSAAHNKVPEPTTHEEVQEIVENSQQSSFIKSQTPNLTSTILNQDISTDSPPVFSYSMLLGDEDTEKSQGDVEQTMISTV
jgi:hypothetical protein